MATIDIIKAEMPMTRKQEPKPTILNQKTLNEQIEAFFTNGGIVDVIPYGQVATEHEKQFNQKATVPQTKWVDESVRKSGHLHCRACSLKAGANIFHETSAFNTQSGGRGRKLDCKKWQKNRKVRPQKKSNY